MYEFTMWVPRLAMGQARAAFLLLVLIFLQGVTALQTSDEANLLRFLEAAQPGYRSVYNTSVPACEWTGVVDCLIGLGAQRRITSLSFSGRGMNGTILPKTLAALTALTSLDLSNNALTGDIPLDLFTFSSLTVLSLGNNRLTGGLHPFVSSLRQLVTLDLSRNFLSGSLPRTLGDFRFLISLYLHSNNFTGTIPVFSYPLSLQHLDLSHNHLTGEVPWAFDKLTQLTHLNLSTNLLTCPITWQFGNLQALQVLDISRNDFEGPIPSFGSLQVLTAVSLSGNRFNGSIPEPLIGLPGLQRLSLANNRLTGPLPPLSPSISFLDCSGNSLSGSIPDGGFGTLSIKVVRLASNNFTGPLPSAVAPQVQELDLQSNGFNGSIPERLAALPGLEKLELSGNQLTGIIPWGFVRLSTIRHVGLARNAFLPGVLPVANLQMVNILFLNLSFCNLGGPIPASFAALHSLVRLDLSHNHFTSTIPAGLSRSAALETLNLSFNNLTGAIPPELTSIPVLAYLDFSYNNLSGEVPSFWDNYDSAAFQGNPQLCGYVLKRVCPGSSPAPTVAPFHRRRRGLSVGAIIGIVIGTVVSFCGFLGLLILFLNRKPRKLAAKDVSKFLSSKLPVTFEADPSTWAVQVSSASSIPVIMFEKPLLNLTFADLLHATVNFHKDNQISDGGYGPTYKGALAGGFQIVVKVLFEGGPANEFEKAAQLEALGKIRHPNLVSLVGYCLVGEERLLVYEFMENGDAHRRLHDLPEGNHDPDDWSKDTWENPETESEDLSWPIRHRIALGVARALAFLHHGCSPHLVHRDVTSSNILLDSSYEPHLADCGLAGLMISDKPTVGGAMGYVPPEYGQIWKATPRGDVYSFGVVLLELVTGKRPTGQYFHDSYGGNLVGWVRALIREKRGYKCLDPRLASSGVESEMLETLRIGYLCTAELPAKRPTMQQIVGLLKDIQNPEFMA